MMIDLDQTYFLSTLNTIIDLDLIYCNDSQSGNDFHSGFYCIELTQEITIETNKQMTVWGDFKLDGILNINGELIIEQ